MLDKCLKAISRLAAICIIQCTVLQAQDWTQVGQTIDEWNTFPEVSLSFSEDGKRLAIGDPNENDNGDYSGQVKVLEWDHGQWRQIGSNINGKHRNDQLGQSVSLSADGTRLAVGIPNRSRVGVYGGQVRVYDWNGHIWEQIGNPIYGEASSDKFGYRLSLSADGTRMAISAPTNDGGGENAGHVQVYEWRDHTWQQLGEDIDGHTPRGQFGQSVSMSKDSRRVAVGAIQRRGSYRNEPGYVKVYEWRNHTWQQVGDVLTGVVRGDSFGWSVSLSSHGDLLAVGAPYGDTEKEDVGWVGIYKWKNGRWEQQGASIKGDTISNYFGYAVHLSSDGHRLAIGTPHTDGIKKLTSRIKVYQWRNAAWKQQGTHIKGGAASVYASTSVALSADGKLVATEIPYASTNPPDQNGVRVFHDFYTSPPINLGHDTTVCAGYKLAVSKSFESYLWNTGSSKPVITPQGTGWYSLTVTNNYGLTATDSVYIKVVPTPTVNLGPDTVICENATLVLESAINGASYLWQNGSTERSMRVDKSGTYWLEVVNEKGCLNRDSIQVEIANAPKIHLGTDTALFLNSTLHLNPSPCTSCSYVWEDGSTSRQRSIHARELHIGENKVFVTSTNVAGCSVSDTIIITIKNQYFKPISICPGDSIWLEGQYRTQPGTYIDTLTTTLGSDSIVVTELNLHPVKNSNLNITICPEDTFHLENYSFSQPGTYYPVLPSQHGCDSTIILNIQWLPSYRTSQQATICQGDSILLDGRYRKNAGVFTESLVSFFGCDSIIVTELSVTPAYHSNINISICPNDTFYLGNQAYYSPGRYQETLLSQQGCDSTITLNLAWYPTYHTTQQSTICPGDSIWLGGKFRSKAGFYTDTLQSSWGCDSIVTTELSLHSNFHIQDFFICPGDSMFIGDKYHSQPGSYRDTISVPLGYDSIVVTNLFIQFIDYEIQSSIDSLFIYSPDASFQWINCSTNQEIEGERNPSLLRSRGSYAVKISKGNCTVVSECIDAIITSSSDLIASPSVNVVPNPTSENLIITFGKTIVSGTFYVYNASGFLMLQDSILNSAQAQIDLANYPPGLYTIVIDTKKGFLVEKVIKID